MADNSRRGFFGDCLAGLAWLCGRNHAPQISADAVMKFCRLADLQEKSMFRKPWISNQIPMTPELIDDCVIGVTQEWRDEQKRIYYEWAERHMRPTSAVPILGDSQDG